MARTTDILDLGSWCILRMSSGSTLNVLASLKRAGMEVWTPVETRLGRKPGTRAQFAKAVPLIPSYVFANAEHLSDLARMIVSDDAPKFSLFRYRGAFPLIADVDLFYLRAEETRLRAVSERHSRRGRKGQQFAAGDRVKLPDGGFAGLAGIVQHTKGQYATIVFPGFNTPVKISSFLLAHDMTNQRALDVIAA